MTRRVYLFIGCLAAIMLAALAMSWVNTRPASPAYISDAVAKLDPQQRARFARYIDGKDGLSLDKIGKPLTRYDVQEAVTYAETDDKDGRLRDAQDQALNMALAPSPASQTGQAK